MLAKYLNGEDSGQYREAALTAAREVLAQGATGELGTRDLNSVFEFLQRYGDASVVPDLEKAAAHWDHYAAMALAGLPNEAGIPALIRLAENTSGEAGASREPALRSLAQVAPVSAQAGSALLEQARLGNIQSSTWPDIAAALAGFSLRYGNNVFPDGAVTRGDTRSFRISTGNQNYRGVQLNDTLPPAQIQQHLGYIDQLLQVPSVASDSAAVSALYGARNLLVTRAKK